MIVRNGFVSNSSSSSFVAYGATLESFDYEDILTEEGLALFKKIENEYFEERIARIVSEGEVIGTSTEIIRADAKEHAQSEFFYEIGFDWQSDDYSVHFGKEFTSMPQDMTRKQWEEETHNLITKYFKTDDLHIDVLDEVVYS